MLLAQLARWIFPTTKISIKDQSDENCKQYQIHWLS